MKSDGALIWGVSILALIVLLSSKSNSDNAKNPFDFNQLTNDPGDLQRLNNLYNVLQQQGLTEHQEQLILSHLFLESGLLTNVANYNNIDYLNNWAGIRHGGQYVSYPDLQSFFNEYLQILSKGSDPINAVDTTDFGNRLKRNGYYESSASDYIHNLNYYFHLLYLSAQ